MAVSSHRNVVVFVPLSLERIGHFYYTERASRRLNSRKDANGVGDWTAGVAWVLDFNPKIKLR